MKTEGYRFYESLAFQPLTQINQRFNYSFEEKEFLSQFIFTQVLDVQPRNFCNNKKKTSFGQGTFLNLENKVCHYSFFPSQIGSILQELDIKNLEFTISRQSFDFGKNEPIQRVPVGDTVPQGLGIKVKFNNLLGGNGQWQTERLFRLCNLLSALTSIPVSLLYDNFGVRQNKFLFYNSSQIVFNGSYQEEEEEEIFNNSLHKNLSLSVKDSSYYHIMDGGRSVSLCTDNLRRLFNLLPCKNSAGLASFLEPKKLLQDSNYLSIAIHASKIYNGEQHQTHQKDENFSFKFDLIVTTKTVTDQDWRNLLGGKASIKDWKELFLSSSSITNYDLCPYASDYPVSNIYHYPLEEEKREESLIDEDKNKKNSFSTFGISQDEQHNNRQQNVRITHVSSNYNNNFMNTNSFDNLYIWRNYAKVSYAEGCLITTIHNRHQNSMRLQITELIPEFLLISRENIIPKVSTLTHFTKNNEEKQHITPYSPNSSFVDTDSFHFISNSDSPQYAIRYQIIIPGETDIQLRTPCKHRLMSTDKYPPEPFRGLEIPPSMIELFMFNNSQSTFHIPISKNLDIHSMRPSSSSDDDKMLPEVKTNIQQPYTCNSNDVAYYHDLYHLMYHHIHPSPFYHIYTDPLLVDVQTPDMSMPFNVITITCSLLAFYFGSLINLLVRKR